MSRDIAALEAEVLVCVHRMIDLLAARGYHLTVAEVLIQLGVESHALRNGEWREGDPLSGRATLFKGALFGGR
jgi:hypothetical protein